MKIVKVVKVIIAGTRTITCYIDVCDTIYKTEFWKQHEAGEIQLEIISGMARGIDSLAVRFAEEHGLKLHKFPANWAKHGKSAGYIRNAEMGKFADALIAIWDGESKGTQNMISYMIKNQKPYTVVRETRIRLEPIDDKDTADILSGA